MRGVAFVAVAVGNIDFTSVQAIYRSSDGVWTKSRAFAVGGNYPVLNLTIDARGQATLAINNRGLTIVQHSGRRWRTPVVLGGRPGFAFDVDAGRPGEVLVVYKTGTKSYAAGRFVHCELTSRPLTSLGSMANVQVDAVGDGSATYLWNVSRELHAVHESSSGDLGEDVVISPRLPTVPTARSCWCGRTSASGLTASSGPWPGAPPPPPDRRPRSTGGSRSVLGLARRERNYTRGMMEQQ